MVNNNQKKWARRGLRFVGGFAILFSIAVYLGIELPIFNHYNPLYNPYYFVLIGAAMFAIFPTFIKDAKKLLHLLDFFDRSGTVVKSYEIPVENIKLTHINYVDSEGEKQSVRHGHAFTIMSDDEITKEYLVPVNGLEALNPSKLVAKYSQKASYVENGEVHQGMKAEDIQTLLSLTSRYQISEMATLDPHVLSQEMVEADDPDALNQEAAYQTAEIRKGWFSGASRSQQLTYIFMGIAIGGFAVVLAMMAGHVDFSHITG